MFSATVCLTDMFLIESRHKFKSVLCMCRSDLSGRLCQVSERGGEQHHPSWEAGPKWRHDLSPLPLFHQLLTQHLPHRYTSTHCHSALFLLLTDCTCSSFILLHRITRSFGNRVMVAHNGYTWLTPRRLSQWNALVDTRPTSLCYPSFNQVVPWDSIHWYSWVKYFFSLVVTVTSSWQCTRIAGTIQRPFCSSVVIRIHLFKSILGELESIESFKWIKFLQRWEKWNFCNRWASLVWQPYKKGPPKIVRQRAVCWCVSTLLMDCKLMQCFTQHSTFELI